MYYTVLSSANIIFSYYSFSIRLVTLDPSLNGLVISRTSEVENAARDHCSVVTGFGGGCCVLLGDANCRKRVSLPLTHIAPISERFSRVRPFLQPLLAGCGPEPEVLTALSITTVLSPGPSPPIDRPLVRSKEFRSSTSHYLISVP